MIKKYLSLVLLLFPFFSQLNAQTLKNIHRHNLPVLQIPIDLIDKVETVDIDDQKHLQVTQFNGFVNDVLVSQIDSITHSDGDALDPAQLGNLRTASVMGIVRGPTGAAEMNAIVRSPYGGEETRTDQNGVFFLNDIVVYDKLGYITITKPGFHKASRSFLPLAQGSNRVNIQLIPMTLSGSFNSASGGQVTSGLLQLNFPANAIVLNGQHYTGTVRVYAKALDPSSTDMFDQMPGELLGGMNDSLRLLRSFGMAAVELRDANMNELQLADGVSVTLTFNIPLPLQTDAPETIDWWSFDEALGYWKHEGEAQKTGTQYIGSASHFSWWNCDIPQNFNDYHGSVNTADGTPISDALVNVVTQNLGTGVTYTNGDGVFTGRVPKNQLLTLNIFLTCETTNDWALAYSEVINSQTQALSTTITASLDGHYPISGAVVNCLGQPVESGYVKMGPRIFLTDNGAFTIQTCATDEYSFRGFNTSNLDSIKTSEIITIQVGSTGVDVGNIFTCLTSFGSVTDIDGNEYQTILIGDQWWMAENLKTSRFEDGSIIPNVTDNIAWLGLNTPAWCNYNDSNDYDTLYGKLYNWFVVTDPRNVCPVGWHSPSDAEWIILTDFLGGIGIAGGKMKTTIGWQSPNVAATNESDFSGLPGGIRDGWNFSGTFYGVSTNGNWWSSSESASSNSWYCSIFHSSNSVTRGDANKQFGFSVRCLKD